MQINCNPPTGSGKMGRVVCRPNSRYPSPHSSSHPVATSHSTSLKLHQIMPSSPKACRSRHLSPLSPLSQRHPKYTSPRSDPPIFVDAKNQELPYNGNFMMTPTSVFDQPLGLKEEGELLMAVLTGMQGSPLQKPPQGMHGWDVLYGMGEDSGASLGVQGPGGDASDNPSGNNISDIGERKRSRKVFSAVCSAKTADAASDTMDLEERSTEKQDFSWLFDDEEEEVQYKLNMEMEEHDGKKPIPLADYLKMVKVSMGRIGLQTQMLHELSLGEDVNMGVADSELPTKLPLEKIGTEIKVGESHSSQLGTKAIPIYKGAMRATSLVIKRLRRMAGLMHTEQQSVDLKSIYDWLKQLGAVATDHGKVENIPSTSSSAGHSNLHNTIDEEHLIKVDWRLPSSPAQALLMAQDDLRQRLAYLYQEQSHIKNRKEQLEAAKRLVGKRLSSVQVRKLSGYLHGLQTLEVGYEELGGRIAQNLDDTKTLETQFRNLRSKGVEDPPDRIISKDVKKSGVKRKKGKKEIKDKEDISRKNMDHDGDLDQKIGHSTEADMEEKDNLKLKDGMETNKLEDRKIEDDKYEGGGSKVKKRSKNLKGSSLTSDSEAEGTTITLDPENVFEPDSQARIKSAKGAEVRWGGRVEKRLMLGSDPKQWERTSPRGGGENSIMTNEKERPDSSVSYKVLGSRLAISSDDKAAQTDNSDLLTLMEGMMEAMNDFGEDPGGLENPTTKLKKLLKENKQMKVQLRFWRSRNWLKSTIGRPSLRRGSQIRPQRELQRPSSLLVDSSTDDESSFYFSNSIQASGDINQGEPSVGMSSMSEDYMLAEALSLESTKATPRIYGQLGPRGFMPPTLEPISISTKVMLKDPRANMQPPQSSTSQTNSTIILDTLQTMISPPLVPYTDTNFSSSNNSEGTEPPPLEPLSARRYSRNTQFLQPSLAQHIQRSGQEIMQLASSEQPLNLTSSQNTPRPMLQSAPLKSSTSLRLSSISPRAMQPLLAEPSSVELSTRIPHDTQQSMSMRPLLLEQLSKGSSSSSNPYPSHSTHMPPLLRSSDDELLPSISPRMVQAIHPLQSRSKSSQLMQLPPTQLSNNTFLSTPGAPQLIKPIHPQAQFVASPRNFINISQNQSPRSPQLAAHSPKQIKSGQLSIANNSGLISRPTATRPWGSHTSTDTQEPKPVLHGLVIVGRSSTQGPK